MTTTDERLMDDPTPLRINQKYRQVFNSESTLTIKLTEPQELNINVYGSNSRLKSTYHPMGVPDNIRII